MIVNISEAKAQLCKLIDRVYYGEKVVIAKNNLPIAERIGILTGIPTQISEYRIEAVLPGT